MLKLRIARYEPLLPSRPLSCKEEDRQFNIFCGETSKDRYISHLHLALLRDRVQANADFYSKRHPFSEETYTTPHRFEVLYTIKVEWDHETHSRVATMDEDVTAVDSIAETLIERILFID